jgi:hypothetical protein
MTLKYGKWPVDFNIDLAEDFEAMEQREIDPEELREDFDETKALGIGSPDHLTMRTVLEFKNEGLLAESFTTEFVSKYKDKLSAKYQELDGLDSLPHLRYTDGYDDTIPTSRGSTYRSQATKSRSDQ